MDVTRRLINWCDKKYDEAFREGKGHKVFVIGMVEGYANAAIMLYVPLLICCALWKHEAMKK